MRKTRVSGLSMPLVSICIPNYNNSKYLDECIQSALNQTFKNIEVVFVDDASSDSSLAIAQKYSNKIRIYRNKLNLGQPKNTNKCVVLSKGRYLVILHSDDMLLPDFVQTLAPLLEQNQNLSMAAGHRIIADEKGRQTKVSPLYNIDCIIPGIKQAKVFMMTSFSPCQVLLRRETFRKIGGVDERYIVNLDALLWFKCALNGDVAYIRYPVSVYRFHPDQTIAKYNRTSKHILDYYATLLEMLRLGEKIPYLKQFSAEAIRKIGYLSVRFCSDVIDEGNFKLAKSCLSLAPIFDPQIIESDLYKTTKKRFNLGNKKTRGHSRPANSALPSWVRDRGFSYDPPEGSIEIRQNKGARNAQ